MATEVAVITAATGAQTFYSNYAAARTAATFKGTNNPNVTLNNVKIISNGSNIFYNTTSPNIEVTNYNLFVNDPIGSNVDLLVGIKNEMDPDYNYLYIEDSDL